MPRSTPLIRVRHIGRIETGDEVVAGRRPGHRRRGVRVTVRGADHAAGAGFDERAGAWRPAQSGIPARLRLTRVPRGLDRRVRVDAVAGDEVGAVRDESFEPYGGRRRGGDLRDGARVVFPARAGERVASRARVVCGPLEPRKEPQPVTEDRAAKLGASVPGHQQFLRLEPPGQLSLERSRVVRQPVGTRGPVLRQPGEPVAARPHDAAGRHAGEFAVLSGCAQPNHLHFLDPVVVESAHRILEMRFGDIHAVHVHAVAGLGAPKRRIRRDSWKEIDDRGQPPAGRQRLQRLLVEVDRDARASDVDQRRGALDLDRVGDRGHLEHEVEHHRAASRKLHAAPARRLEALELGFDVVVPWRQCRESIGAIGRRRQVPRPADEAGSGQGDFGVDDHRVGAVAYGADDRRLIEPLRTRERGRKHHQCDSRNSTVRAHRHPPSSGRTLIRPPALGALAPQPRP